MHNFSELFWSLFFRIRGISPHPVQMRNNADQNNSKYGQFPRSDIFKFNLSRVLIEWLFWQTYKIQKQLAIKGVFKNFAIITRKHLCWNVFLIRSTLLKRDSNTGIFP